MRVCLVYDCLFPYTVGGAERWYRELAAQLAGEGHEVTYITRRQWERGESPELTGVRVMAVSRGGNLYTAAGTRRAWPPVAFATGVLWHLVRRRREYDIVHTCSFPYFPLLAARLAVAGVPARLEVDWFEVWSRRYWLEYAGPLIGRVGDLVQRLCVRLTPRAFTFSNMATARLRAAGVPSEPVQLSGLYTGTLEGRPSLVLPDPPVIVYAGRHTIEKQVQLIPSAIAAARRRLPELRGLILGDGPLRPLILSSVAALGLEDAVDVPGFVAAEDVVLAMAGATCVVVPSMREGYGLVVVEAASTATPVVVVGGEDNAAVELVDEGVNGFVVGDRSPEAIAAAVLAVQAGGEELRARCAQWFAERVHELTAARSARVIVRYDAQEG